jgi:hypothetical protein
MTFRLGQMISHHRLMEKVGEGCMGILLALGLATLCGIPHQAHGAGGRDYARCIQSCNAAVPACLQECSGSEGDCAELFPDDPPAQQACEQECERSCDDSRGECRLVCENIKLPVTPEEP